jgi:PEP-CTERM motif
MKNLLLTTLVLSGIASFASAQSVIYRETFGNSTGANASLTSIGWAVHSTGGLLRSADAANTGISNQVGGPTGLANVNAGGVSASETNGLAFSFASNAATANGNTFTAGNNPSLIWTNEYTVDRSVNEVTSITFNMFNSATANRARIAIQISTQWYATNFAFTTTATGGASLFATNSESKTFTFSSAAADWRELTFNGSLTANGSALSISAITLAASLPSGNITAFGMFMDPTSTSGGNNSGVRFDTYTINATAIPEPSSFAALAGIALLGFAVFKRRKSV